MLDSSSRSLVQAMGAASEIAGQADASEQLGPVFHSLKGLLLNMGENAWAAFARDVERRLKGGLPCDMANIVADMRTGLTDILLYRRDEKKN